jgi:hypothetical protein
MLTVLMRKIHQHTNFMRMAYLILINFVTYAIAYAAFPNEINCSEINNPKSSIGLAIFSAVVGIYLTCLAACSVICLPKNVLPHIRLEQSAIVFLNLIVQLMIVIATFIHLIQDKAAACENPSSDIGIVAVLLYEAVGFLNMIILLLARVNSPDEA